MSREEVESGTVSTVDVDYLRAEERSLQHTLTDVLPATVQSHLPFLTIAINELLSRTEGSPSDTETSYCRLKGQSPGGGPAISFEDGGELIRLINAQWRETVLRGRRIPIVVFLFMSKITMS